MIILWLLFIGSFVVLPGTALLAFGWALRQGEFNHLQKAALSIFDEDEPLGVMSDRFPDAGGSARSRALDNNEKGPTSPV